MKVVSVVLALMLVAGVCFAQTSFSSGQNEVRSALDKCEKRIVKTSDNKGEVRYMLKDQSGNDVLVYKQSFESKNVDDTIAALDRSINQLKDETERSKVIANLEAKKAEMTSVKSTIEAK